MPFPRRLAVIAALVLLIVSTAEAQFGRGRARRGGFGSTTARLATDADFDGRFNFCRIVFRNALDGDGGGWSVDYPRADENLSIRLSELTKTTVSRDPAGDPKYLLIRLTDPQLFSCPFIMITEPGGAFLDQNEATALRTYLMKGGFLWADDFWGEYAWAHWANELRKALPAADYPIVDLPVDHPIFHTQFDTQVIQIPSIGAWRPGVPGGTSERGADSAVPHARGISDAQGRLLVFMTHNTDYGDAFEREGDSPDYFYAFGPGGYALGVNVLLYSMTH